MKLRLSARWHAGETDLDARLFPLLRTLSRQGSLNRAVAEMRLSYRHAWGMLGRMERALGRKLVVMERGRGARLSPFAERLIETDDAAAGVFGGELGATVDALNHDIPQPGQAPQRRLLVHASHDFALAALRDCLAESGNTAIELHFRGSLDCLASLARGECDVAGFHLPETSAGGDAFAPYRPLLRMRGLRLVRFVNRNQGLIVARGNPRSLLSLADVAAKGARFVNRQPDSGTRLAFDRLLVAARLRPAQIKGYEVEEFTHAAVAATIASGMADAGFGIEAAARQHGLDFVSLAGERYYLAARAATLVRPDVEALLAGMRGPLFLARLRGLAGYEAVGIGQNMTVRDALQGP